MCSRKAEDLRTLDQWKAILSKDLFELRQLTGQDEVTRMRRSMKEQEIGQHCYEAGESLNDLDLASLKQALALDEEQWRAYQSKVRPEQE
jgi:hypothetical protein